MVTETKPRIMSVPEAGKAYFDLGPAASYEAANKGLMPTIRCGRRLYVLVEALERKLRGAEQ